MVNGGGRMTTRKRKAKGVPPSRLRYQAANPTVSVRISQELKQELEDLKITTGMSMAEILKAGLDKIQPDAEEIYERGYVDGYEVAEEEFKVMATCSGCGKAHLPVTGELKTAAARWLIYWSAKGCR